MRSDRLPARTDFRAACSVVIPVFNGSATIKHTVQSVLAQHPPVDEVVVVNDGSTDATLDRIPHDPRVRVITQPNGGEGAARNTGIAAAAGPLVFFVDADDFWLPGHVETNLDLFTKTRGEGLLYCSLYARKSRGTVRRAHWWGSHKMSLRGYLVHLLVWRTPVSSSSVAIAKPVWERLGLRFDPSFRYGADLNMWIRALSHGPGFIARRTTVIYDRDSGQLMNAARQNMICMPDYFSGADPAGFSFSERTLAALFAIKQAFFIGLSTDMPRLEIPDSLGSLRRLGLAIPFSAAFRIGRALHR